MKITAAEHLRRRAGTAVRARLYATRPVRLLAEKLRPRALVLVYHRVGEPMIDPFGQAVSAANFGDHLAVIQSRYAVQDVSTLVRGHEGGNVDDGTVVVTFDDGYADVLHQAAPIASAAGVPLHLFVTVDPVDGDGFWWDELASILPTDPLQAATYRSAHERLKGLPRSERRLELELIAGDGEKSSGHDFGRPLDAEELVEFVSMAGMSVGAHTLSHPSLGALAADEQSRELREAKRALEKLVGLTIETVAYPFGKEGDVGKETPGLAAEAGYRAAFTSIARPVTRRSHRFLLPRLAVHDWPAETLSDRLETIFGF